MNLNKISDQFLHPSRFSDERQLRRARLLVRACLLTSFFSTSYIWLSVIFSYEKGVYFMIFNVLGFLLLPLLLKTKLPMALVGNLYVFIGAIAVLFLIYYSGGVWSAIYPWTIAIPVLALLVVNRTSGWIWGGISLAVMLWYIYLALTGHEFPTEYNQEMKVIWHVSILPGLMLIILLIAFVFQSMYVNALNDLEKINLTLFSQNETIAKQSGKLEKLVEEKDYIIRILAHDLRNPLSNVSSLVELMKMEENPINKENYMNMVVQATTKARDLVNKVLEMDVSDQESGGIELSKVKLMPLISEVTDSFQEQLTRKDIRINIINDYDAGQLVFADKTYLALILDNLLSNAIKFSGNGSEIKLEIMPGEAKKLQISVTDEGPGIHPDHEDKIFQKFSRIGTKTTGGESSTGLGLSLVKRYAELIQADVRYERPENKGATFIVSLTTPANT